MTDMQIYLGGLIMKDNDKEVRDAIAKYLAKGTLPKDHDVVEVKRVPPTGAYWNHVNTKMHGFEPIQNSGDLVIDDQALISSTSKGKLFSLWLANEFPLLSDEDKELFHLVFEQKLIYRDAAKVIRCAPKTVERRVTRLRRKIGTYCGIKVSNKVVNN